MRRLLIALLAGVAVAVPASVGLLGNASFAERLPLHSPTSDLSSSAPESPTPTPSPTESEPGDDHGGDRPVGTSDDEPGDDHGGDRPVGASDDEPGDDHGGDRPRSGDDDNSGPGSQSSGHGPDDSTADDDNS
ncbi:MAG TPA: hypothetical protein VNN23_12865, partial [Ornithinibacter sp.]|nr:hypothetical protein [Ornithinibacter sp.]